MPDNKIGYIINESGYQMEDVTLDPSFNIKNCPYYNKNRVAAMGVLQTGEMKNRNGRIYRTEDLVREINAPRQQELLRTGNMLSELNHPLSSELLRQQTIDQSNCCARFLKFWNEGNNILGIFQGTNNSLGETFDKDLRMGVKPSFSLRALGTVRATPQGALVENLKMITYDTVIFPSYWTAYTKGIISESANISDSPVSNFKFTNANDATKSFIYPFNNADVVSAMKAQHTNESAIEYIKDKSFNYHLLKEAFDMTKVDMVDLISPTKIALTESGNATIVMNVEDYIAKEIQNYRG